MRWPQSLKELPLGFLQEKFATPDTQTVSCVGVHGSISHNIYLCIKYLLSTPSMEGTFIGAGNLALNKTKYLPSWKQINK